MSEKDWVVEEALRALETVFGTKSASLTYRSSGNSCCVAAPADDAIRCEHVRAVLSVLDDLPGMSSWLQREQPHVWSRCVESLRHVDAIWGAPMIEFDEALRLFEIAFCDARELYRTHLQKPAQGVLEGLQAAKGREEGNGPRN